MLISENELRDGDHEICTEDYGVNWDIITLRGRHIGLSQAIGSLLVRLFAIDLTLIGSSFVIRITVVVLILIPHIILAITLILILSLISIPAFIPILIVPKKLCVHSYKSPQKAAFPRLDFNGVDLENNRLGQIEL